MVDDDCGDDTSADPVIVEDEGWRIRAVDGLLPLDKMVAACRGRAIVSKDGRLIGYVTGDGVRVVADEPRN